MSALLRFKDDDGSIDTSMKIVIDCAENGYVINICCLDAEGDEVEMVRVAKDKNELVSELKKVL